jgi:hypothetical protein
VNYIHGMARYGHPINITKLKLKVAEATQDWVIPFTDGIPGSGWLRWFRKRHPKISLHISQGLDTGRAQGLCPEHVATFYDNLQTMFAKDYGAYYIWNCEESEAQAGRNVGGRVLAKMGVWNVHSIIPKEREWLSVLVCVNPAGYHIPSFYIFRGKSFQRDYIKHCEDNASMAIQPKAWMTGHLFKSWIWHFVKNVKDYGLDISPFRHHLLILNGHGSHVTVDVVKTARSVGLDLLTLPSHTSHAMQPLDVSCFKPFKQAFMLLRDVWTRRNKSRGASKEVLAEWVSQALEKALSLCNIKNGFRTTWIFSFNPLAMATKMGPTEFYKRVPASTLQEIEEAAAINLDAPKSYHMLNGSFIHTTDFSKRGPTHEGRPTGTGGPAAELALGEEVPGDESNDEGYGFEEEEEYLNRLETALAQPEAPMQRMGTMHYYVPARGPDSDPGMAELEVHADLDDGVDRFFVLLQ